MDKFPDAMVFATGSTKARTRLYRIGISNNLSQIEEDFDLYGLVGDSWYAFQKQTEFDAFLVAKKKKQLYGMRQAKNRGKKPSVIKVDKDLDNYLNKGLFKEKVDKANQVLKTVGLPKFSK